MEREIRATVSAARKNGSLHLKQPEAAFLNQFAVPVLFEQLRSTGLSKEQASAALLHEYHRSMPGYGKALPNRSVAHPFTKRMSIGPEAIYRSWTSGDDKCGLTKSGADLGLRAPFPHRILFEGKYFAKGNAARELVKILYQAFFYLGLPKILNTKPRQAEWNYDYACLMAYDASPKGTLLKAWRELPEQVRRNFWDGANIYVMILGGEGDGAIV
jgi:hypothetical protein